MGRHRRDGHGHDRSDRSHIIGTSTVRQSSPNLNLWLAISAAVALVLFRSFVFLWYEHNFDSDQAIVGLMAKHLSEFRAFPLFFYGQNYMLGVEAWLAVPFFWLGGPTVTMLRLPLVLINVAVVILLIRLLVASGLRPSLAFVAAMPIAACGPVTAYQLLTPLGASIEPLLYVIILWRVPHAAGAVRNIALHRFASWRVHDVCAAGDCPGGVAGAP
jgi:hypothetical protein